MQTLQEPIRFDDIGAAIKELNLNEDLDNSFIQILNYLKTQLEARTILVEENYIDKDFSNELSNLYSKTFKFRSGYCQRLHFFKEVFENLTDFIEKFNKNKVEYLGFIVRRPIEVGKVGRTIVRPKNINGFFYLCTVERDVHIIGKTIAATGVPFIEQDSMVITCAQSTIWMASQYMHYKHRHTRHLPFDITEKATSSFAYHGRSIPSSGLTLEQMVYGLNNMGYFPIFNYKPSRADYDINEDDEYRKEQSLWNPIEKIYPYIESEIPVLISFKNHVCMVVGHKLDENFSQQRLSEEIKKMREEECEIKINSPKYFYNAIITSSIFVDAFIIHDDQRGIYKLLPSDKGHFSALKSKYENFLPAEEKDEKGNRFYPYKTVEDDVQAIIVPLPDKIYLLADEAFDIAKKLFKKALTVLIRDPDIKNNRYAKDLISSASISAGDPVVFRTYFLPSVAFKEKIKDNNNMCKKVIEFYISINMPRFVWIIEISTFNLYQKTKCILGEILIDSTANKYDRNRSYVSIHLPGLFMKNEGITSNAFVDKNIPTEEPYHILRRSSIFKCRLK